MRSVVRVTERVEETPSTVTLRFPYGPSAEPGQFVMLWIPGDDELPMSLSFTDEGSKGVTVKSMGDTSRRIQSIRPGDAVAIRGPYGRPFPISAGRTLVVAGGSGSAVLAPAVEQVRARGGSVVVALGATQRRELLFRERFERCGATVRVATDDGSEGFHGYVTEVAATILGEESIDAVWTCGPERMMDKVVRSAAAREVPCFGSVERHMKCALGMCDACAFGPFHVCTDGPVFDGGQLASVPEFGRFHRDPSGRRASF